MWIYNWIIYIYNLTILEWQPRINTPQHRSTRSTRFLEADEKKNAEVIKPYTFDGNHPWGVKFDEISLDSVSEGRMGYICREFSWIWPSRGLNSNGTSCLIASMRGEIWWNWLQISSRTQWGVNLDETCWELTSTKAQMRSNSMKLVSYEHPWGINSLIA
jgi:hypothetical protein